MIVSAAIGVWGISHDIALGSSITWKETMDTIVVIMVMGLAIGVVFGIIPGIIIGAVAGTVIGWLVWIMQKRISPKTAPVLGILVSIPMILAIHLLTWRAIAAGNLELKNFLPQKLLYLLTLGVPSILFAFASAWVSWKLHEQLLFHE